MKTSRVSLETHDGDHYGFTNVVSHYEGDLFTTLVCEHPDGKRESHQFAKHVIKRLSQYTSDVEAEVPTD
jgi:hypothetical protein